MRLLSQAIVALSSSYTLSFPHQKRKVASSEFFIPALVLILLKAKLSNPIANQKIIGHFGGQAYNGYDYDQQKRVLFSSCNQYLLELKAETLNLSERERLETLEEDHDFFSRRAQDFVLESSAQRMQSSEFSMHSQDTITMSPTVISSASDERARHD